MGVRRDVNILFHSSVSEQTCAHLMNFNGSGETARNVAYFSWTLILSDSLGLFQILERYFWPMCPSTRCLAD